MIACPNCGSGRSSVVTTRPDKQGRWRRRVCDACGHKFSTVERVKPSRERVGRKSAAPSAGGQG